MPFPNPLASLKSLPKNQRVAVGVGGVGALGAGLYTLHKRRAGGASSAPANAVGGALQPAPDLSQYGQVAVLVPIDHQDGANFGGSGGLIQPPAAPPVPPTPSTPKPPKPAAPAPTYAELQSRLASGQSSLADRRAFWQLEDPNYGGGSTPQSIQADANLARVRAGSLALQRALAQ